MTLTQIEYFVRTAEQQNFTRAAEACNVSQPTLSKQIANLEEELGTKLFIRNNKLVELTEQGQILLPYYQEVLKLVSRSEAALKNTQHTILSVGISEGMDLDYVVPGFFKQMRNDLPDIKTKFSAIMQRDLYSVLENYKTDVLFVYSSIESIPSRYVRREVSRKPFYLYYSPELLSSDQEVTLNSFRDLPFIEVGSSSSRDNQGHAAHVRSALNIKESQVISVPNIEEQLLMLESAFGFTAMGRSSRLFSSQKLNHIDLSKEIGFPLTGVDIVYSSDNNNTALRRFIKYLGEYVERENNLSFFK